MSVAVMGFLADRYIEVNNTHASDEPSIKITVRVDPVYVMYLDDMAKRLDMSRTALATQLLEHAVLDAKNFMEDPASHIANHEEEIRDLMLTREKVRDDAIRERVHHELVEAL